MRIRVAVLRLIHAVRVVTKWFGFSVGVLSYSKGTVPLY
jgi:hypothetical protein